MPRISQAKYENIWGKAATLGGVETQRSDLWLVDFTTAAVGIRAAYPSLSPMPEILPQYVRSISLPETKLRTEVIRRCSIPYNTPSWDEPLEALKVQFMLVQDLNGTETESAVFVFLNQWMQLVRTGRGLRTTGGPDFTSNQAPPLHEGEPGNLVIPPYRYSFQLILLRGTTRIDKPPSRSVRLRIRNDALVAKRKADEQKADRLKQGLSAQAPTNGSKELQSTSPGGGEEELEIVTRILVEKAWLASFKLSDLSYENAGTPAMVDASFYADSLTIGASKQ